jgi:glutamyl-tRNA synthetase
MGEELIVEIRMIIRTRFAPSPTGSLHIGSVRTALYAWLFARHSSGEFVLRIEDTDLERSTQESIDIILNSMEWLNLDYDVGPLYQTKRLERYHEVAQQLLAAGKAYKCYCTKERLETLRERQFANKEKPRYDGCCRDKNLASSDQPYVIRFKNPLVGEVSYEDQVLGKITFQNSELDDIIIVRSDGSPTYNFCNVVDDMDMQITHVIRGADHVNNTPRQINMFRALGIEPPLYGHLPMILGNDGKLLSKRHGAVSVLQYRDQGFLPEALLNYLVRLGWSHGDQEIFSREEMIKFFEVTDINKAAAAFDNEKLLWLNRHYLKTLDPQIIAEHLEWHFKDLKINITNGPKIEEIILAQRERTETLREMATKSRFFYEDFDAYQEDALKHLKPEVVNFMQALQHRLAILGNWTDENLHQVVEDVAKEFELKLGKVAQPLRVAVSGSTISPPINITLRLLGKSCTLERIDKVLKFIQNN